jgi:hypothetical protein
MASRDGVSGAPDRGDIGPDIPDAIDEVRYPVELWRKYPGLTDSKYFQEYLTRLVNGRDMHTIVTAAGETGVGKTTVAFAICFIADMHGWLAEKASLNGREYSVKYDQAERGEWLLGDELEQMFDVRRGMSKENVEASHDFAGKRYKQVFTAMTLPTKSWADDRIASDSVDYWLQAQETDKGEALGEAKVYRLKDNEHYEQRYKTRTETISWPVLDDHPEKKRLDSMKAERMEGVAGQRWVHQNEVEELKENYWNKATKQTRYHIIKGMATAGISQTRISEILNLAENVEGLSQPRVSTIVNSESFEEVYSG